MSGWGRWLSRGKAAVSHERLDLTAEAQNMDVALRAAERIMNDDIAGAEAALQGGDSAFHKLAKGTLGFMKSTLGFEQDVMRDAINMLNEAENSAYTYYYKAQHDSTAYQSHIYDKGAEFLLCQAEAQIMSAIVGVLNESVTESLKGFYKMRKAYGILEQLLTMEQKYMAVRGIHSLDGSRAASRESLQSVGSTSKHTVGTMPTIVEPTTQPAKPSGLRNAETVRDKDSDSDDFFEVDEGHGQPPVTKSYEGHLSRSGETHDSELLSEKLNRLNMHNDKEYLGTSPALSVTSETPSRPGRPPLSRTTTGGSKFNLIEIDADDEVFKNKIDIFIHSGTNLMFGIILLMISVIPPAFARILSVIGFRGNREKGQRMLWQASKFNNVNGGMAALMLFGWYNGVISFVDIVSDPDPSIEIMDQVEGYPAERMKVLLQEMRERYPDSHLWMIEEARMAGARRDIDTALELLTKAGKSEMKQLQALQVFEKSLNAQNSHRYELCADAFLECVELNAWSQALYYFVAGAAYLERSRDLADAGDLAGAKKFEQLAEENIKKAPAYVGKKKMLGKPLPFDQFVARKVQKWTAQSEAWGCSFFEAVGVPPIEESIFLWNGFKKQNAAQLQKSLDILDRAEKSPYWERQGLDEKAIAALLRANVHRNLRDHKKAQDILEQVVFPHDKTAFAGQYMDTWAAPASYYEHAVNSWMQRREYIVRHGSTLGGPSANRMSVAMSDINADRGLVADARKHVEVAKNWGAYELDARIGMKITAALGAIGRWEQRNAPV